jgi:hypothetical protein
LGRLFRIVLIGLPFGSQGADVVCGLSARISNFASGGTRLMADWRD